MRTGGYTLQQSLTPDAANIVKQAVNIARRRGHAQVTPLHVASAMLASSTGLLKRACLQSHSHPLQCKALELCFNVALNRLPTSTSNPLLGPHSHLPSLSNALVAGFKRAQAHQRRGSIENQQQSILALKVEIEQLVISILDDPSVSRVMREAGFSSTQVKNNVEHSVSLDICNSNTPSTTTKNIILGNSVSNITPTFNKTMNQVIQNDDVMSVLDAMMNRKTKNTVIVGECLASAEGIVRGVIDKFDKKDVPVEMRYVQFISVPLFTLRNISREEFEMKLAELRSLVKSHLNRGVVLYLGDLNWVSEFWSKYGEKNNGYYCPVEYMIMELSRLTCGGTTENTRLWLMGTATFHTYAKCKVGRPSLETLWSLHPLRIPVGNLALSLSIDQSEHLKKEPVNEFNWLLEKAGIKKQLICCSDCSVNFNREAEAVMSGNKQDFTTYSSNSSLPLWLQQYKDENIKKRITFDQECDKIKVLCKKWNSICSSVHKKPHFLEKVFNLSTTSPSSSTSVSSNGHNKSKLHKSLLNWPIIFEPNTATSNKNHIFLPENDCEVVSKPELLSNPNSSPNSASSSEASDQEHLKITHKFNELNQKNISILSDALEKKVPWQKDIIHEISTTILECRSGTIGTKTKIKFGENREESWLFFLGVDSNGKETIARELAKTVFGSYDSFVTIGLSSFSSSDEEVSNNKRARNEHGGSVYERFLDGVSDNPSRVFFIEDVDEIDYRSLEGFKRVIEDGSFTLCDGEIVLLKDAIVIFSCEKFGNALRGCTSTIKKKFDAAEEKCEEGLLDLNNIASDDDVEDSVSENGILDLVDKQVVFKLQAL
ncbi:hypothetical protein ACJIZ3_022754 [Penstemon smallii]|uniref:Clp R domain-containing protein n=1 Tax=Penstemon smallii TaxID=265156 RepID=A0ABD3TP04_9LAMI